MAVSVTRLDSQNVGLRLLGQTSVAVLSLDLTTGLATSAYFGPTDLLNLQNFALSLFRVVPKTSRSAAALGLLSRLCAVSAADASTVTTSASVVAGVATLTASVTASPASLILTIPYAMTGGVMPSSGGGGGGPPGPATDSNLVNVASGEALAVGDLVAVTSGSALKTDPTVANRMPCIGIVSAVIDPATVEVRVGGVQQGLAGLTPGRIYYAGSGGALTFPPPSTPGASSQAVGLAVSSGELVIAPSTVVVVQ